MGKCGRGVAEDVDTAMKFKLINRESGNLKLRLNKGEEQNTIVLLAIRHLF